MRLRYVAALLLGLTAPAIGQQAAPVQIITGGSPVTNSNPLPVSASVSITGFQPVTTGTPISVTTGGVTGTLPASQPVVVAFNTGATNTAYCKLGASATTSDIAIPPASWFAYTVGAATQLTCITSTSTTTVNMIGGTGLPTGAGGGGGGGSGGAITIASSAVASGAYSAGSLAAGAGVDGWDLTQGTKADSAYAGSGSCSTIACLKGIYAAMLSGTGSTGASVPTTALYAAVNVGGNLVGIAPGTAGSASTQVTTVQGIASMTPILSNPGTAANWGVVATGAAPPANAVYTGALESGATGGHVAATINCDNHVFKHITSATDTLAVQGVASQTVYVCGATGQAAGTATWFLENTASTNANCSSSNTQITGVGTLVANTGSGFYAPIWGGLKNTSGNGLCINSTGTGGVDVDIWYTQF